MGIKTREYGYGKQVRGFSVSGKDRLKLETSLNIHNLSSTAYSGQLTINYTRRKDRRGYRKSLREMRDFEKGKVYKKGKKGKFSI